MTIGDKIGDEKLQYDIKREAARISALSSGKIHKYRYFTGEEKLPTNQRKITEQAKFAYFLLEKAFEKHTKKYVGAITSLDLSIKKYELTQIDGIYPQNLMNELIHVKLKEMVNLQDIIKTDNLHYKSKIKKDYNFSIYYLNIVFKRYTWRIFIIKTFWWCAKQFYC